jgi:hypothetical protein
VLHVCIQIWRRTVTLVPPPNTTGRPSQIRFFCFHIHIHIHIHIHSCSVGIGIRIRSNRTEINSININFLAINRFRHHPPFYSCLISATRLIQTSTITTVTTIIAIAIAIAIATAAAADYCLCPGVFFLAVVVFVAVHPGSCVHARTSAHVCEVGRRTQDAH